METMEKRRVAANATAGNSEAVVRGWLESAAVRVGGSAAHDITIHDPRFYARVFRDGSLGLGEAYMEGWWDSEAVDQFASRMIAARIDDEVRRNPRVRANVMKAKLFNLQSVQRAFQVGEQHYDIGNDLYRAMLDRRMVYTCGYWKAADDLEAAQEAKLELVCRKIGARSGMRILELGCGWAASPNSRPSVMARKWWR